MSKQSDPEPETPPEQGEPADFAVLTVNQLVAYNLMKARRRAGWTQAEAAERLNFFGGRRYTAATLSASERSWESGRSREFDASELLAFSLAFDQPIPFFFLPLKSPDATKEWRYALKKGPNGETELALVSHDVLDHVVPIRYSASFVGDVNELLRERGITWEPSARVERYDPSEAAWEEYEADANGVVDGPPSEDVEETVVTYTFTSEELAKTAKEIMRDLEKEILKRFEAGGEAIISREWSASEEEPPF
ncbi:helix-turn-helix transcriptional regulator [Streptomyces sp. SID12501]|uniref:Helix-turn-helix transcriptional regulator n=1 Tax=Streptomyces sp. SID12501 TaxID=2706042 RepID=A0A6B3C175_9ACTN|nr:helix-turn-helix transcriptional regulator [Streptomyces sp. SID12501]NEC90445.1 helix-turn-helix transcriptional regulator [Streptomyces sp. SID12501]